jgi:hypothetical protein
MKKNEKTRKIYSGIINKDDPSIEVWLTPVDVLVIRGINQLDDLINQLQKERERINNSLNINTP